MEIEQLDPVFGEAFPQLLGQSDELVVAQPASGPLGVDHHPDRGVRSGRRDHPGYMVDRFEQLGRKINAHNAAHRAAVDGHQNEGLFGHEAQNGGQRRDQRAGSVELEVGLRCRHAPTIGACADQ